MLIRIIVLKNILEVAKKFFLMKWQGVGHRKYYMIRAMWSDLGKCNMIRAMWSVIWGVDRFKELGCMSKTYYFLLDDTCTIPYKSPVKVHCLFRRILF